MHVEFLVEEPSAEAALTNLLPKILTQGTTYKIHPHQGKDDLLKKLPGKLKGYRHWIPSDWRIVVLIDEDRQDCHELKQQLERDAAQARFITKEAADSKKKFQVINRIAIEELESWFFGDVAAIKKAYPRVPATLADKSPYRDPDAIQGGTWEALWNVLKKAGYYHQGYPKIEAAKKISEFMDPERNISRSFQVFRNVFSPTRHGQRREYK